MNVLVYCDYEEDYIYKDICTTEINKNGERVCFYPVNSYCYNHEYQL